MEQTAIQEKPTNPLEKIEGRSLLTLSFEELSAIYPQLRDFSVHVYEMRMLVMNLLAQKMIEKNATKVHQDDYTLTLKTDAQREFNYEILENELMPLITEEQWTRIMSYEPKVSWQRLKELKKIGGKVLEVIERAVRESDKHFISVSGRKGSPPAMYKGRIYPAEVTVGVKE